LFDAINADSVAFEAFANNDFEVSGGTKVSYQEASYSLYLNDGGAITIIDSAWVLPGLNNGVVGIGGGSTANEFFDVEFTGDTLVLHDGLAIGSMDTYVRGDCGTVLSTNELNAETNTFAVFPMPASGHITVSVVQSGTHEINVYNNTGQLIVSEQVNGDTHEMNTSNWEPGVYMLQVDGYSERVIRD
jgi:hypothetical protein